MKATKSISTQNILKSKYATYLREKLNAVYKNYFPFEELSPLDQYLRDEGVYAEQDRSGNPRVKVRIKMNPLRIEVQELANQNKRVVWQMVGA